MDGRAGADPASRSARSSSTSCPGSRTCRARARRADASTCRSRATATTGTSRTRTASSPSTSCARPVGQTVKLDVTAPDFDVIHSWWIPALGGKFDAIPGTTNVTWFNAEAPGHLPRPVRRVLRDPARQDDGRGRGDAARGVRRLARARRQTPRRPARPTSARRRSPAPAPSATASRARATSARGCRETACSTTTRAVEQVVRERPRHRCRRSARTGRSARWRR